MPAIFPYLKTQCITIEYFFVTWPRRGLRLIYHLINITALWKPVSERAIHYRSPNMHRLLVYLAEVMLLVADLMGLPDLASIILHSWHPHNKPLNPLQKEIIHRVFGDEINLKYVLTDNNGKIFDKRNVLAFVSFNTIHFNVDWTDTLLMHEATHVWQYQHFGSLYIIRALLGQRSEEGYKYGGKAGIRKWLNNGRINDINYEQQAEIITDYYDIYLKNSGDQKNLEAYFQDDMFRMVQKILAVKY